MSLYTDYVNLTILMERVDDLSELEVNRAAELAHVVNQNSISVLVKITELFDEQLDSDGCWDENTVCARVSHLLHRAGFFLDCPCHGFYARNKPQCPTCEMENT